MVKIVRWLLRLLYGFRAYNDPVLKTPGPVLLLPNHVSWWDWVLIGACLENDWRFATSSTAAETSWFHKRVMVNGRTFPIDMNSPYAAKHMAEYLHKGGRLVLFPEGRISASGSLMKFYEGTGFLIAKTGAKVITAYLRGAKRLPLSRNPDQKQWFPRISAHFSNILTPPALPHTTHSHARSQLTDWVRDQMVRQQFETEMQFGPPSLPEALVEAARLTPGKIILEDTTMQALTYRRLLTGIEVLAGEWRRILAGSAGRIGVLLPNVNTMPVVLFSLWAAGKIPAILNYTAGTNAMLACARIAGLRQIVTSRAFLQRIDLDAETFQSAGFEFIYLEDLRKRIAPARRLGALIGQMLRIHLSAPKTQADDPALILFTSGSESEPKAVELTHSNLLANIRQMLSIIDLLETDRFFSAMPLFHSFGLTVGLLLPLVHRVFAFLYLSPLHYRIIPAAFYNLNCTVLFGTNTFLAGYARKAHPYDFRSLRYVIAGAEKLQPSTETIWMEKFGVRVLHGYGVTECSPVLSVNLPMHPRPGSTGRLLPGIDYRIEPVEGISAKSGQAGRLLVRGPNVMRGYLNAEANARFKALQGWYDTGDIACVDPEGFVFIRGRLKRFAKISGEMVSLAAVEDALAGAFPQFGSRFALAIMSRPDEQRGEKLVVVTNEPGLTLEDAQQVLRSRGVNALSTPRELQLLSDLPRLATGKIDYRRLESIIRVA